MAETPLEPSDLDELAERLRSARSEPRSQFVRDLEGRLFGHGRRAPRSTVVRRPAFVLAGAATALAGFGVALALAGLGPASRGSHEVRADDCRTATVERHERVPHIVTGSDGRPRIRYEWRTVERPARDCP